LINISVNGCGTNGTTNLGNVYFEYVLDLEEQQVALGTLAPANNQVAFFQSTGAQTYTTAVATTALNATASTNGLGIVNTSGSFVPPPGNYIIDTGIIALDNAAELLTVVSDIRKNNVSIYSVRPPIQTDRDATTGPGVTVNASGFIACNGTDTITQTITLTGAAGVLTADSWVRFLAV